jgi:hypothetical protein
MFPGSLGPWAFSRVVVRVETRGTRDSASGGYRWVNAKCAENEYDKAFEVIAAGQHHIFDSFECAAHRLAPVCEHCGCKVIGHGVEVEGRFYCCAHCARETEHTNEVRDRIGAAAN